jgi:poly-beta-1,6-N-acetyl-D-glucosamine synthase
MDFSFPELDFTPLNLVFYTFLLCTGIQLLYTILIYFRFSIQRKIKSQPSKDNLPPVSVIIAARNEEDNLYHNLPAILEQDYPEFEVIVVNHQSIDDSGHILRAYSKQYPHLKIIEIERNTHLRNGKKLPITMGIKGSKYNHFVFTDADCKPAGPNWLSYMASSFSDKKQLVLGYGPYRATKGFLNFLIRFDTAAIAVNYFSYACAGIPYMGVGRNIAYTRELFDSVHGFKSHYSIQSGDDDLFVRDSARKRNYSIQFHPDSYCYSDAEPTWHDWVEQKNRHFTTSPQYRVFHKALLGIYPFTLLMMLITFFSLVFRAEYAVWTGMCFGGTYLLIWLIQAINLNKLGEGKMAFWFPFLNILHAVIIPVVYYSGDKNDVKWK